MIKEIFQWQKAAEEVLSLPISPELTDKEMDYIIDTIANFMIEN